MTCPLPPSGAGEQVHPVPAAIPRLKFSLKLKPAEGEECPVKLVSDESIKSTLPKITLSVRRTESNKPEPSHSSADQHDAPTTVEVPKKRRGRPPKNLSSLKMELSDPSTRRQLPTQAAMPNRTLHRPAFPALPASAAPKPLLPAKTGNSINLFDSTSSQRTGSKAPITANTAIGDAELAKIGRLKGHLSTLVDADVEAINHADYSRPFASKQDMIDRLLPFHLLSMAALQVTLVHHAATDIDAEMDRIRSKFQRFIQEEDQRPVSTELNLLEQRLCLEEEKFLLEKMRSEYKRRMSGKE